MKKILLSLSVVAAVAAVVLGATTAFYNDEEASSGNVLAAGSIDLGVDNESYYNGVFSQVTSWGLDYDLDGGQDQQVPNPDYEECLEGEDPDQCQEFITVPRLFFNFSDLKPGDYGEDTISLHVKDNEAWVCADVTLTSNDDMDCTEPEEDAEGQGVCQNNLPAANEDGDLAQDINFLWWADDGDNVLEARENQLEGGNLGALGVDNTATVTLADSLFNIWTGQANNPFPVLPEGDVRYIGKAFCFGDIAAAPDDQDGVGNVKSPAGDNAGDVLNPQSPNGVVGEPVDGGFTCSGQNAGNESQTDKATLDITFRAEQSRHRPDFTCGEPE